MPTKKILVLAQAMAFPEQIDELQTMLGFLEPSYQLDFIDPLTELSSLDNKRYYMQWQTRLSALLTHYQAFIGFSFGAVILQQSFPVFEQLGILDKPVILFSAPAFVNQYLEERLGSVVELAQRQQFVEAHQLLMKYVLHPFETGELAVTCANSAVACKRLIEGLTRVTSTDSRTILSTTAVEHYHFVGEQSYLVNKNHIPESTHGKLLVVPNAGMRVLQDNQAFCHRNIREILV